MKFARIFSGGAAALTLCLSFSLGTSAVQAATPVSGIYVEARNADVFVGDCHFGSEYQTLGRDAILAWHINQGDHSNVSLAGMNVVAVVAGDNNLAETTTVRHSVIYVDARATKAQAEALVSLAKSQAGKSLGSVLAIKPSAIRYHEEVDNFQVEVPGAATLNASRLADRRCCTMRYQVWYKPLAPVSHPIVGSVVENRYSGHDLKTAWSFPGQNSAFIGDFSARG